jgi:hypothetical protein
MELKTYTEKSFVIIGEDIDTYKDKIKDLGGKWNGRLTNKETGERFGAWLFWSDKRSEIQRWLDRLPKSVDECRSNHPPPEAAYDDTLKRMDELVSQCQLKLDEMKRLRTTFVNKHHDFGKGHNKQRLYSARGSCRGDNSFPEQAERKRELTQKTSPVIEKYTGYCSDDEAPAKPHRRLLR